MKPYIKMPIGTKAKVEHQIAANALPEILCNTSNTTYILCNNHVISIISYHKHTQNNGIISHIAYVTIV